MPYLVNLTERAQRDLLDLYDTIQAADSDTALRWYLGLKNGNARELRVAPLAIRQEARRLPRNLSRE